MQELLSELSRLKRDELRDEIEKIHDLSVLEYSRSIYSYQPSVAIEPILIESFKDELARLNYSPDEIDSIIENLTKHRVIQAAPHVVLSYGPRMLCIDWQGSLGVDPKNHYIVGMYSGIPYSNSFFPGHLTFNQKIPQSEVLSKEVPEKLQTDQFGLTEKRVSFIPSRIQDELVFRSDITEKTREMVMMLSSKLQPFFNHAAFKENSYSKWAIQSTQKLLSTVLKKDNLVYLDINEVVSNYLIRAFSDNNHLLYKLMFELSIREKFQKNFNTSNLFLFPYLSEGFPSQENLSMVGNELVGKNSKLELKPEIIIDALQNKRLCPGLLLTFTTLSFLNGFKCLGSFWQSIYLPEYKEKWLQSGLLDPGQIENVPVCNLTTGFFTDPAIANTRPLDIILGMDYNPDPNMKMGELILSVKKKFLGHGYNKVDRS